MSVNIQTVIKELSDLDDETRIKELEMLVRSLNRKIWAKNRTGTGKRVLAFLEDKNGWCDVRQISDELGDIRSSVSKIIEGLTDVGIVDRRDVEIQRPVYPDNWGDMGDYARRQWRKRSGTTHWLFPKKYEYKIHSLRGMSNDK